MRSLCSDVERTISSSVGKGPHDGLILNAFVSFTPESLEPESVGQEAPDSYQPPSHLTTMPMNVPFFRYPQVFPQHQVDLEAAFVRVANSGGFILQADLAEFAKELAQFVGCTEAIGIGNATDVLEMLVAEAGIGLGDEVLLPSHTLRVTQ
jgi:hypothetical protein